MDGKQREDLRWWAVADRAVARSADENGFTISQEFARTELQRLSQGVLDLLVEVDHLEQNVERWQSRANTRRVEYINQLGEKIEQLERERDEATRLLHEWAGRAGRLEAERDAAIHALRRCRWEAQSPDHNHHELAQAILDWSLDYAALGADDE